MNKYITHSIELSYRTDYARQSRGWFSVVFPTSFVASRCFRRWGQSSYNRRANRSPHFPFIRDSVNIRIDPQIKKLFSINSFRSSNGVILKWNCLHWSENSVNQLSIINRKNNYWIPELMLSNYEMSSVCVDVGVMWRLSEDLNRRFAARVQHHHPHHHVHGHRTTPMSMLYNGINFVIYSINKILLKHMSKYVEFFFKFVSMIHILNTFTTKAIQ